MHVSTYVGSTHHNISNSLDSRTGCRKSALPVLPAHQVLRQPAHLAQEAGDVLAAAVAHVACGAQLAHAGIHKGEASLAAAPPLEGFRAVRSWRWFIFEALRPGQPVSLLHCCEQEEVPAIFRMSQRRQSSLYSSLSECETMPTVPAEALPMPSLHFSSIGMPLGTPPLPTVQ